MKCTRCTTGREAESGYKECPPCRVTRDRYRVGNRQHIRDYSLGYNRNWREQNREKINQGNVRRHKTRMNDDIGYRLKVHMRLRTYRVLKGIRKEESLTKMLGCTIEKLKLHLVRKFQLGMTFGNYGQVWHIDHIKPCSAFDLTDPEQQKQCFHYTNLQPLFAMQNILKGGY